MITNEKKFDENANVITERGWGRGRGRGRRGGRGRSRGGNQMNQTFPKISANLRLQRPPNQPLFEDGPTEDRKKAAAIAEDSKIEETFHRNDVGRDGCICIRDVMLVFCTGCGFFTEGE